MTSEAGTTGTSGILTSELLPDFFIKNIIYFTTQRNNLPFFNICEVQDNEKTKGKIRLGAIHI